MRFHVINPSGHLIHEADKQIETLGDEPVDFELEVPTEAAGATENLPLTDLNRRLGLRMSDRLIAALEGKDIRRLSDVRALSGVDIKGLSDADREAARRLNAHATFGVLSSDLDITSKLVQKGLLRLTDITRTSRASFVKLFGDGLGDFRAAQLHVSSQAVQSYLDNVATNVYALGANGMKDPFALQDKGEPPPKKCQCRDCEAAVSPAAYLADLIQYAQNYLHLNGNHIVPEIDPDYLPNTFHQPFKDLAVDCHAVGDEIRQMRICVEVLRRYLNGNPPPPGQRNVLARREGAYRLEAYTALLQRIGTSYSEIRLATTAAIDEQRTLASRVSIGRKYLSSLLIGPDALTEKSLEKLFGLIATVKEDGSLANPLEAKPAPDLLIWKLENLRDLWFQQDWLGGPMPKTFYSEPVLGLIPT